MPRTIRKMLMGAAAIAVLTAAAAGAVHAQGADAKDPRLAIAGTWRLNEQYSTSAPELPVGPAVSEPGPRQLVGDRGYRSRKDESAATRIALRALTQPYAELVVRSGLERLLEAISEDDPDQCRPHDEEPQSERQQDHAHQEREQGAVGKHGRETP